MAGTRPGGLSQDVVLEERAPELGDHQHDHQEHRQNERELDEGLSAGIAVERAAVESHDPPRYRYWAVTPRAIASA